MAVHRQEFMRSSPYSHEIFPQWLFPSLYVVGGLLINFCSGALSVHLHEVPVASHAHNVGAAIGLPLLTGYFWYCLRLMDQSTDSVVMSNMLEKRELSQFGEFRRHCIRQSLRHTLWASLCALAANTLYAWREGFFDQVLPLHSYVLLVMGFIFWLFFGLFAVRISSCTRLLINRFGQPDGNNEMSAKALKRVFGLGIQNILRAAFGVAMLPVFWLNQPLVTLDLMMVSLFVGGLAVYLVHPVFQLAVCMQRWQETHVSQPESLLACQVPAPLVPVSSGGQFRAHPNWPMSEGLLTAGQRYQLYGAVILNLVIWSMAAVFG